MKKIPIAIQLYSLREETEKDFAGTLRKVAEVGYDGVEFAGYGNMKAKELKELMDELKLQAAGAHIGLPELEANFDEVIEFQKTIGNQHIVCPILSEEDRISKAAYEEAAKRLNEIGKKCAEQGAAFSYHNHNFELKELDGVKPLDIILQEENVLAELDVYWLKKAGENPLDWLNKYKDKTRLVHLKDMTTDEEQFFAELGTGGIDLPEIIEFGKSADVEWFIVEQDVSRIGLWESAEINRKYLKENFSL